MRRRPAVIIGCIMCCAVVLFIAVSCRKKESKYSQPAQQMEGADWYSINKQKVAQNPNDANAWNELGYQYDEAKVYDKAADAYGHVIKLAPNGLKLGYTYFKLGNDYIHINQPEKAVNSFKMANKLMPGGGYAIAYNNMGVAYGKMGKTDEEIQSYKQAIKLRPSYADPRMNLGVAYLKKGDRAEAVRQYNILKGMDQQDANILEKFLNEPKGK